jgi:hypothetical protein
MAICRGNVIEGDADAEKAGGHALYLLDCDLCGLAPDAVFERFGREPRGERLAANACRGEHPGQRSLELADVRVDLARYQLDDFLGDGAPAVLGLFAQYRDAGFEVGRLQGGDEPPLEPADKPLFEGGYVLWGAVGRDHDLFFLVVKGVESVEELFLRRILAGDEVYVVDEQDVYRAKLFSKFLGRPVLDGRYQLIHETFGRKIPRLQAATSRRPCPLADLPPDCLHQVGLAHAYSAVKKERVVYLGRVFCDAQCRRMREQVAWADDEIVETVLRIELGLRVIHGDTKRSIRPGDGRLPGIIRRVINTRGFMLQHFMNTGLISAYWYS